MAGNCDTFFIGSCSNSGTVGYSNIEAYAFRIYGRGLTDKEVKANYEKATKYHSVVENE